MNNCILCNKPTSHVVSIVGGGIRVCLDCFFKDIPNPGSRQAPDFKEVQEKRQAAIVARADEILKKYGGN